MSSVKFDGFWSTVKARELLPPCPPPDPGPLPALPSESPARSSDFGHGFTLSTHLSPGAFPRSTPFFPAYPQTPDNESKEERQSRVTRQGKELFELRQKYGRGELDGMEKNRNVVWTCFNRYVRQGVEVESKMGRRSLTLFLAHANGMHKETFEPMLHRLLALNEKDQAYRIDEIWTYDAPQHGDSALINGDKLGCLYDWIDNTRDILNFFLYYLPETVSSTPLSTHLPEVPKLATAQRKAEGFTSRNLVAVGHSFGGASLTVAAYHVPTIFSGLVLIDPVIAPAPPSMDRSKALFTYVTSSFARRISWPNREEAYKLLKASPFFSSWHDDVLKHYIQYGMTETKDGAVRLKCTGYDEAYVFADHYTSWEAFSILPNIDVRIPIKWINPPAGPSIATREEVAQARIWRRPSNTTSVVIEKALHLVVQDSPDEVATEIHKYLIPFGSRSQKTRL